eukprot:2104219-Pleurochrysis_carterae.AAC.1
MSSTTGDSHARARTSRPAVERQPLFAASEVCALARVHSAVIDAPEPFLHSRAFCSWVRTRVQARADSLSRSTRSARTPPCSTRMCMLAYEVQA